MKKILLLGLVTLFRAQEIQTLPNHLPDISYKTMICLQLAKNLRLINQDWTAYIENNCKALTQPKTLTRSEQLKHSERLEAFVTRYRLAWQPFKEALDLNGTPNGRILETLDSLHKHTEHFLKKVEEIQEQRQADDEWAENDTKAEQQRKLYKKTTLHISQKFVEQANHQRDMADQRRESVRLSQQSIAFAAKKFKNRKQNATGL